MSHSYWKDSAVNLFPRGGHFRIPRQWFLKVNGQGLLFPKTSARYSNFVFIAFVLKTILFASLHVIIDSFSFVLEITSRCAGTKGVMKFSAWRHKMSPKDCE